MRTLLPVLVATLALAAIPLAAGSAPPVALTLEASLPEPGGASGGAESADGLKTGAVAPPEVETDIPTDPKQLDAQQLLESTTIRTGAGGAGFSAEAEAEASGPGGLLGAPVERIVDAIAPAADVAGPAVVTTVGVAALFQALGVWRFLGVGALALYSRLTKSDLLDNGHRDRVYKLIQEEPGLGVSEIAERTGLGWGTTVYHLDRLERAGFVANERGGLHKCYFPVGTLAREVRKGMGALKADTTRNIAEFLVAKPGATQTELCSALGLSPSAASKQVTKLEEAGLVRRERDWKTVHLYPQEPLHALLGGEPAAAQPAMPPVAAPPVLPA